MGQNAINLYIILSLVVSGSEVTLQLSNSVDNSAAVTIATVTIPNFGCRVGPFTTP